MTDGIETFKWEQLAKRQKIYIAATAIVVVVIVGGLVWDSFLARSEVRKYEKQARDANEEKEAAYEHAAKIASQIQILEGDLKSVEVKRDAKRDEVKKAGNVVANDRAEYERAVRQRSTEAPSTDELCRQLAAVGHPCSRR